jgi:hypothetical protein
MSAKAPLITDASSFFSRVHVRGEDECWPWARHKAKDGYTWVRYEGRTRSAHGVAHDLVKGPPKWPAGKRRLYRHTCDSPPCCNPRHIVPGDDAANARDRVDRERSHKFPAATRAEIARRYMAGEDGPTLGAEFGVSDHYAARVARLSLGSRKGKLGGPKQRAARAALPDGWDKV